MGRITGNFYLTMVTETTMYRLSLTPSSIAFSYDSDGDLTGSHTIRVGLTEHKGEEIIKHTSEPIAVRTYRGWDGVADLYNGFSPITINARDAEAHESVTVEAWKGVRNGTDSVLLDSASVPIIKEGRPGKGNKGARMRQREWASYTNYLAGVGSEEFYDVVIYDNHLYLCLKSHTSYATTPPESISNHQGLWEAAQDWAFIATKLLLTEKIHADQIDATGLKAQDVELSGVLKTPWVRSSYKLLYSEANVDYWGFDCATDFNDHVKLAGSVVPGALVEIPWGEAADGRILYIDNWTNNRVKVKIPSGNRIFIKGGCASNSLNLEMDHVYRFIGTRDCWFAEHICGREYTPLTEFID